MLASGPINNERWSQLIRVEWPGRWVARGACPEPRPESEPGRPGRRRRHPSWADVRCKARYQVWAVLRRHDGGVDRACLPVTVAKVDGCMGDPRTGQGTIPMKWSRSMNATATLASCSSGGHLQGTWSVRTPLAPVTVKADTTAAA